MSSSPALSLSLAIHRDGGATAEISSGNSGPAKSRSDDDCELAEEEDDDENDVGRSKKKRRYHRHTPEQIKEMEALFKESPHPDEKQRLELSNKLGLHPRQVKFWFQNRRTQIKAVQERHENSLLKAEIDRLQNENIGLREAIHKKNSCPKCGPTKDNVTETEIHKLSIENSRLRVEIEQLKSIISKTSNRTPPYLARNDQETRSSLNLNRANPGLEKPRIIEAAERALEELKKMASVGEPLWIRSYETGREILNYDEYRKEFCGGSYNSLQPGKSVEASRESAVITVDLAWLVRTFMNVNQWKELFPCLISKAISLDVICNGEGATRDGAIQLMFAEIQMLTPMVATREVYFIRYSKQIGSNQWAIVDVSLDGFEDKIDASLERYWKRPSGCIIEDRSNSRCKVTWVEHMECQRTTVHALYRAIVNSGMAFGAKHWIATLQQQCERVVFLMATNVPLKDSNGCATNDAGRRSILKLAQRMSRSLCRALGHSSFNAWKKVNSKTGDDIRVATRRNLNDPGEPRGTIISAASCVWLPVPHHLLFDYLRDEKRRNEWELMSKGSTIQSVSKLRKGQVRGNIVTAIALNSGEHKMWVLQDSGSNAYESMVTYASVDSKGMEAVNAGLDSSNLAILPSGFWILPDGIETRPLVITCRPEEKSADGGSLLTVAFQVLINNSPAATVSDHSVESISTLISRTLQNIKTNLHCED